MVASIATSYFINDTKYKALFKQKHKHMYTCSICMLPCIYWNRTCSYNSILVHTCSYTHMHTCTNADTNYTHSDMHTNYTHTQWHADIHIHTYTHMHVNTYRYTHIYPHAHAHTCSLISYSYIYNTAMYVYVHICI